MFALGAAVALARAARRRRASPARAASPVPIARGAAAHAGALGDPLGAEHLLERGAAAAAGDALDAGLAFDLDLDDLDVADPTLAEALAEALGGALGPALSQAPAGSRVEPHPYPAESLEEDLPPGEAARAAPYGGRAALGGGDLYGVHVATAGDRAIPDDDLAYAEGQSWLEHLAASAAESGPAEPTLPVDALDESDRAGGHHKTATTDTPVADRGAGGPRGL